MSTIADKLRQRTFQYALSIVRYCRRLPDAWHVREIARQLLRSGTGAASNYWSACRGRSPAEFIARLGVAEDEAAESVMWLALLVKAGICEDAETEALLREGREITAILSKSHQTARENRRRKKEVEPGKQR
ncbi:MAG TPA: four helix bundle protein [Vicinamibacterales bacterium]|jgi:four helix bundle protein